MRSKTIAIVVVLLVAAGVLYYYFGPLAGDRITLLPETDAKKSAVVVNANAGGTAVLERPYSVVTVAPKRMRTEETDDATTRTRYKELFDSLPARPRSFLLYFETGGTRFTPESQKEWPVVLGVLKELQNLPASELVVIGHADEVGSDALNDELSRRRATTIADLIKSNGIKPAHVDIVGRGSRDPLVEQRKGVPQVRNRRVEIRLK